MKYIVMECHLSYAVVLDEDGRFLKVANLHYEVGQTVTDVVEMRIPHTTGQNRNKKTTRWLVSLAALAACLLLVLTFVLQTRTKTFATVYLTINPDVRMDVDEQDVVIKLEGINPDGKTLIEGYNHKKKKLERVVNDLVDRAIDMEFLQEGGQISLTLDAESGEWISSRSDDLINSLSKHLDRKISVTIVLTDQKSQKNRVIIPVESPQPDYDDSDYGNATTPPVSKQPVDSDYDDSDYGDGQTDYDDRDDDSDYDDGQSDFNDSDYDDPDYDDSDYAAPAPIQTRPATQLPTQTQAGFDDSDYGDSGLDDSDYN